MSKNQAQDILFTRKTIHEEEIDEHVQRISYEFKDGFEFLKKYPKSVTIFGSSMLTPESQAYKNAVELGARIARDLKYAVLTGGGPGIMEAANEGAFNAKGQSVGLNISLPHEHKANAFMSDHMRFAYFFSRKTMLTFAAEAYVFFPGGFGTCDELFSIITLIQTGKIPKIPVILFDSNFWNPILSVMKTVMLDKYKTIDPHDLDMFTVTDSIQQSIEIIAKAPISEWWRVIN